MGLINEGLVRHVRRQVEHNKNIENNIENFPSGAVLYQRFEPEVEAVHADDDIRDAFHAINRQQLGSIGSRIAAKTEEGPKKRARRAMVVRPQNFKNQHMIGSVAKAE